MTKVLIVEDNEECFEITKKKEWEQDDWLVIFISITSATTIKKIIKTINDERANVVFVRNHYTNGMRAKNIIKKIGPQKGNYRSNITPFNPNISWVRIDR